MLRCAGWRLPFHLETRQNCINSFIIIIIIIINSLLKRTRTQT